MGDKVTVFDPTGKRIGELPGVIIQRTSLAERTVNAATGSFVIGINESFANENLIAYWNHVLVQSDQEGIEDWCGLMQSNDTGVSIKNSEANVPLVECTYLLNSRFTQDVAKAPLNVTPGQVFRYILYNCAQHNSPLPTLSYDTRKIDMSNGSVGDPGWNAANCYEILNKYATDNDFYWWFEPSVVAGRLSLIPVWRTKQSSTFVGQLVERSTEHSDPITGASDNSNFEVADITERTRSGCSWATRVRVSGKFDSWRDPVWSDWQVNHTLESTNHAIIEYQESSIEQTKTGQLNVTAKRVLRDHTPRIYVIGIVNSGPYPRKGDTTPVVLAGSGSFLQNRNRQSILSMRVTETTYSPNGTGLVVTLEEVLPGE